MVGTQDVRTYINSYQATVEEWVAITPIFKFCAQDTGCNSIGGDRPCGVVTDPDGILVSLFKC